MGPELLAGVSIATTLMGGAVSAAGTSMSAGAQSQAFKYQAGVAQLNERISKQNADYSRSVGEVEAQQSGMKNRQQVGQIRVAQSASGLDINKGSAKLVSESQKDIGAQDQALIRSNAAKRAYGYEVEAAGETAKGHLATMSAANAETAGKIGVASSILGTATSVSSKWLDAKRVGMFA